MGNLPAKKEDIVEESFQITKPNDIFLVPDIFAQAQRGAELLAASNLVPTQYQKNMPNCFIALATSRLLDIDVFAYMQNSYVIHGRPGIEAKLKIAMINTRGPFKGPIQWRMEGKGADRSCTAHAIHGVTGELCEATVTWAMVTAEKWNQKPGSKWNTLPDLMFKYRSASFLGNLYCPEVTMGMKTIEELEDIEMNRSKSGIYEVFNAEDTASDITEQVKKKAKEHAKPKKEKTAADLTQENKTPPEGEPEEEPEEEFPESPIDIAMQTAKDEKAKAQAAKANAKAKVETKAQVEAVRGQEEEPKVLTEKQAQLEPKKEEPPSDEDGEVLDEDGEVLDEPASDEGFGWV